ncbi:hypothetical protein B9Z19DRAFT_1161749 [Tuber borchii]|uniref:Uncharacterized protein n=1 Tax=Tuber borchii TaxID=42251 RepID=A0A2T6ZE48_TUBBO|nr:hypothetical protein B9Z19DRAFT_1161749 [Tuber borchii]
MPPVCRPPKSATIAVEITAEPENFKARPAPRKAPMSSIPKKPTKGGGKAKRAPKKKRGGRKKKEKAEEVESSGESVIESDIKDVAVVVGRNEIKADFVLLLAEYSDNDSADDADDGGSSAGGESDFSEYEDKSYVIVRRPTPKRATDKGVSSKTSSGKNATTVSGGSARKASAGKGSAGKGSAGTGSTGKGSTGKGSTGKGSTGKGSTGKGSTRKGSTGKGSPRKGSARKSAVDESPKKREGKSTSGKKGRATVRNTAGENSNLLDDTEDGYYPDDENDENDKNYLETSKTPAKRAAEKATGGSVGKGTTSKTTSKTSAGRKTPTKATVGVTTRSSLRRALMAPEGEELPMTTAKKRKAPSQEDSRLKKVPKTGTAKNVGVVRVGLESLSLGGADDDDVGEVDGSMHISFGKPNTGYIIKGGTYPNSENTAEQRAAVIATNSQSHYVLQSEPVIGKKSMRYGGKSVAGLKALWEVGPPKYDSE